MIKSVLIDARTPESVWDTLLAELAQAELWGFDIETQDEARHAGLNIYNTAVRHVFDHRRTVITGFSTYVEGSDTAYYFNLAHADVANRLPADAWKRVFEAVSEDAICVAHNAPYELTMTRQCWNLSTINNIVCTLQMAVSHHGPDEYPITKFYETPLPRAFLKFAKPIIESWSGMEQGDRPSGGQLELLGKFISKTSKSEHSYNGYVKSIAIGYNLKQLTKSVFGYDQLPYETLLKMHGAKHMGELTGEQVCAYGADDAYWAVRHYRNMFDDMIKNNPGALHAFFSQENPMIHFYAEAWREGVRLDLEQVFDRRDIERQNMAKLLRDLKPLIKSALPFPADPHPKLLEREVSWYPKAWQKKRRDIEAWANSKDEADDFRQCYQVSNPIGNAWAAEKGLPEPKGRLNVGYWQTMRSIMYDLLRLPMQYAEGKVASDSDARGRIREKLEPGLAADIMAKLQDMADIEQRMKLYLTPYTQLMDPETSRVYPSLSSQLATRRLATSFPNPMQLAKQGESAYIRSFYLGDDDDCAVVSADWSAVELVIIGDMSGDEGFRKVYGQIPYGDMHTGSAVDALSVKTMPGITEDEFREFKFGRNPNDRRLIDFSGRDLTPKDFHKWARGTAIGKGINFGYWYSGAVSTVASNLGMSDEQHWELVDKYRARFPDAEAWRVGLQEEAAIHGFVTLPDGHRRNRFEVTQEWRVALERKFADISVAPPMLLYGQTAAKRLMGRGRNQVVNSMVQGTNAALAKRSMINIKKACEEAGIPWGVEGARLMMPVHDELVFSVRKQYLLKFIPLLRKAMAEHPQIVKNLPLNCTVAIGRTFRPFDSKNPKLSQIELDEAQAIPGIVEKELEGTKLSDDKVAELVDWMFTR